MWVQSLLRRPLLECHSNIFDFALSRNHIQPGGRLSQQPSSSSSPNVCCLLLAAAAACCCKLRIYSLFFPAAIVMSAIYNGKKGMIVFHGRAIREEQGCNCNQLRWITKSDNKGRPHANYPFVTNKPNKRGQNNRRRRRGGTKRADRKKSHSWTDGAGGLRRNWRLSKF